MKRTYVIRCNEKLGPGRYSTNTFVQHIVRKLRDDLVVKIDGQLFKGRDMLELQLALSQALFPYVIEEMDYDDDPSLGEIYESIAHQEDE